MKEPEAETHWLDQHRDPTEAAVVWSLAAQVVAQHGGDLRGMRRALGIANATWVGGGLAVRIANTSVVDGMAAEVALVRGLPPEVGHPKILGAGTIEGHDWIVTEEVRGLNLHEAWPTLTPEERRRAIRQLWARVRVVHDATPSLRLLVGSHTGFIPATLDDATAAADRVSAALALPRPDRGPVRRLAPGPAAHRLARDRRRLPRTRADMSRRSSVDLSRWVRRHSLRRRATRRTARSDSLG